MSDANCGKLVPPARFELATLSLEVSCSIQLSYGGVKPAIGGQKELLLQFCNILL